MSDGPEKVSLPRASKGDRSQFFDDPATDQVMTFLLEMMAEMSTLRNRVDTIERLLDDKGQIDRADIEAYRADPAVEAERAQWNQGFIRRVMRLHGSR